ncbi:MAG: DUF748 domain-containing protein [Fimbriimonadaceae bacterium]|nr:DUF748 domain-containing protein [Chitinophagales bacterium]
MKKDKIISDKKDNTLPHKKKRKRRKLRIFLIIVCVLIVIRIILPYILLHYANKSLANMKGYYGHIDDIDLALIRGAYQINDIYLNKKDTLTGEQTDFFDAKLIDLSVEWKALFKGEIVGELLFETPSLKITKDKTEPKQIAEDSSDFRDLLKDFMPLKINRFEIKNGNIHYIDNTSSPLVDVALTNTYVLATNLKNSYDSTTLLPAKVIATANLYEGNLKMNMNLDALSAQPLFDMNLNLENTNLVLLNEFFQAYANVDVNKGTMSLYTEFAAKEGNFAGYVKPVIKDLDVLGKEDKNDPFLRKVWEGLVGGAGQLLENKKEDQIATKVPIEGSFESPNTEVLTAVAELLRNAFIRALAESLDYEVDISTVDEDIKDDRKLFDRIFDGKKDKEEGKKDKKDEKESKK